MIGIVLRGLKNFVIAVLVEVCNDFVVTSYQTTGEGEAARVNVRGDDRGEPERRGIVGSSVRGG